MLVWVPDQDAAAILEGVDGIEVNRAPWDPDTADRVEALVAPAPPVGIPSFSTLPRVRLVQSLMAGVDVLLKMVPPNVTVCDARGAHDVAVAEWVMTGLLAMFRRLDQHIADQRAHRWVGQPPTRDLHGARVLIVGAGSIGEAVATRTEAFGAEIVRVARTPRDGVHGPDELDRLLPTADAVVLLVPLTDDTKGLLDAEALACLPDGAVVVNASRGAVIDQAALERELRAERLRAVLDVTDPEPLPADHSLWDAPGLIITPHVAGWSPQCWTRAYDIAKDQLERLRDGRPLQNVVENGY